jgi:hypothetical protein
MDVLMGCSQGNALYKSSVALQDNVSRAFVVRVSNADSSIQGYTARQCLRILSDHLTDGSDHLLATCVWTLGEYGDLLKGDGLLEGSQVELLEGEEHWAAPGGGHERLISCLQTLLKSHNSGEVRLHACSLMAMCVPLVNRQYAYGVEFLVATIPGNTTLLE